MKLPTFRLLEATEHGKIKRAKIGSIEFLRDDWLLACVSWSSVNPKHWIVASNFRLRKIGEKTELCMSVMNPGYGIVGEALYSEFHTFLPKRVIGETRKIPK
jgi:hypothetical protein